MSRYLDKLDLDPAETAEVEERLNTLNRVLNKYGPAVEDAMAQREQLGKQIAELEKASDDLSALQSQIDPLVKEQSRLSRELTTKRQAAAKRLSPMIESELSELGMEKAEFTIVFTPLDDPIASGGDQVEFVVGTNPGQSPQPLRKIASGGELSRIMLALKGILAAGERVSVLVFDEIDANVGGRLGSVIGAKLRKLASRHQVLCITHLPQIASYADRHLTVRKTVAGGKTQTTVRSIDGAERLEELAEMIGGQRVTQTTRAQATELLESARVEVTVAIKSTRPTKPKKAAQR